VCACYDWFSGALKLPQKSSSSHAATTSTHSSTPSTCWTARVTPRTLPLAIRKAALAKLLADQVDGIFIAEYEQGNIGDT
jgi:hypothetical protein